MKRRLTESERRAADAAADERDAEIILNFLRAMLAEGPQPDRRCRGDTRKKRRNKRAKP